MSEKLYRCPVCNTDKINSDLQNKLEHMCRVITMMDEKIQILETTLAAYREQMAEITSRLSKAQNTLALSRLEESE